MARRKQRRQPPQNNNYIRLESRTSRGTKQVFDLQTAVTTFERVSPSSNKKERIDLHAQIHFGSRSYFESTSSLTTTTTDTVHYELLVDDELMKKDSNGNRVMIPPSNENQQNVFASASDQRTAQQYGLENQVNVMDYTQPNWIHADMTRQEFLSLINKDNPKQQEQQQPLWALASTTASTWPGSEAFSALFEPYYDSATTTTTGSTTTSRSLFSNLFWTGNSLALVLRLLFWILVPTPELNVMLLDWSLLNDGGGISRIFVPVMTCLLTGNFSPARQLVFAQLLLLAASSSGTDNPFLIAARNQEALKRVFSSFEQQQEEGDNNNDKSTTLLYGAMHCPDLSQRLQKAGFVPTRTTWRTAWSVEIPTVGTTTTTNNNNNISNEALGVGLVLVPLYLLVGGLDWIGTGQAVQQALAENNWAEASVAELLYLIRHVALYIALAKFVVDWRDTKLFE